MTDQTYETDQAKRGALLDKISALLAKTELNGCTESEALAAAELAQRLMDKYGLSLSELQIIQSPVDACEPGATTIGKEQAHEVRRLAWAIALFTDTKCWLQRNGMIQVGRDRFRWHVDRGIILVYFGLPADVAVATYLTDTFRIMMDTEWNAFWSAYPKKTKPNSRTARSSFMRGMTDRLSERLEQMKLARNQVNENNCREIVLVKERIVEDAFNTRFGKQRFRRSGRRNQHSLDDASYYAGAAAGDRVSISSGALEG